MDKHEIYIQRCIQLAKNGLGTTRPNPMVGAVIVHENKIIGEGYTSAYGKAHAEVNAINSIENKELLKESTLYVTLEPCSHYGKTPPCSDLIIKSEIPEVIIGTLDDNHLVAGKGIAKLESSGCTVRVGILEQKCRMLHKRFFTFHNKNRPYVILKWAESKNGFIAPLNKENSRPVWISNTYSRQLVHKWRAEEQAILVGLNTVKQDNPSLTVRDWTGEHPIRFLLSQNNNIKPESNILDRSAETFIFDEKTLDFKQPVANQILNEVFKKDINSIIIEGGARTLQTFIEEGLWDEARVFIGSSVLNQGIKAPIINGKLVSETKILEDTLKTYTNSINY